MLFNRLWAPRSNPSMHLASHLLPASTGETLPPASALWPIILLGGSVGGVCMHVSMCVCGPQGLRVHSSMLNPWGPAAGGLLQVFYTKTQRDSLYLLS